MKVDISAKIETFVAFVILLVVCLIFGRVEYYARLERESQGVHQTGKKLK